MNQLELKINEDDFSVVVKGSQANLEELKNKFLTGKPLNLENGVINVRLTGDTYNFMVGMTQISESEIIFMLDNTVIEDFKKMIEIIKSLI